MRSPNSLMQSRRMTAGVVGGPTLSLNRDLGSLSGSKVRQRGWVRHRAPPHSLALPFLLMAIRFPSVVALQSNHMAQSIVQVNLNRVCLSLSTRVAPFPGFPRVRLTRAVHWIP